MSKRDLQRTEVLSEVLAGRRTTVSAASVLNVSVRQAQRLSSRYKDGGGAALIHKAPGRTASNRINVDVRDYTLELVRQNYRDFGPTLAAEVLLERNGIEVSRATLRKWMVEAGLWLSRKQRRSFHQPRLRLRATASWSRSMVASIAGLRIEASHARCWSSSMTRQAS